MSYRATVELILQLHEFHSTRLPFRSRYALRAQIYQALEKNRAMPYNIIESPKDALHRPSMEDMLFCSRRIDIAHSQETFELNDICQFRIYVDAFPKISSDDPLCLEISLVENALNYEKQEEEEEVEYLVAETVRFKLDGIEKGILQYCEGQFSGDFTSKVSFTLFAMVTEYRFMPLEKGVKLESDQQSRAAISQLSELLQWSVKGIKQCNGDPLNYFFMQYIKPLKFNSVLLQFTFSSSLKNPEQKGFRIPTESGDSFMEVQERELFHYFSKYVLKEKNELSLKLQMQRMLEWNFELLQSVLKGFKFERLDIGKMRCKYASLTRDKHIAQIFMSPLAFGNVVGDVGANVTTARRYRRALRTPSKIEQEMQIISQETYLTGKASQCCFIQVSLPSYLKTNEFETNAPEDILRELSEIKQNEMKKQQFHYDERRMLVIYVHGLQATSYDMEMLKREIQAVLPLATHYASTANEGHTNEDIGEMGSRLANQIRNFVGRRLIKKSIILNFVGHSMGGVIARACLHHLQDFSDNQFGFFCSFSTPHLGYLNGVDGMIKTGLWVLRKIKDMVSLDQLAMEEKSDLRQTLMYKLSLEGSLKKFTKIILVSHPDDSYVAWHSARISPYDSRNSHSKVEKEMIDNILGEKIVHRIDVHSRNEKKDLNSFIGRTAHIDLLSEKSIIKLICLGLPTIFDVHRI